MDAPGREHEGEEKGKDYHRRERYAGHFKRTMRLPEGIGEKDVSANLKEGVLKVRVRGAAAENAVEGSRKTPIEAE